VSVPPCCLYQGVLQTASSVHDINAINANLDQAIETGTNPLWTMKHKELEATAGKELLLVGTQICLRIRVSVCLCALARSFRLSLSVQCECSCIVGVLGCMCTLGCVVVCAGSRTQVCVPACACAPCNFRIEFTDYFCLSATATEKTLSRF
jgi:hypothetical protein